MTTPQTNPPPVPPCETETVQIETNTAEIVNLRSHEDRILDAMQAIRIPEVDFRQANDHLQRP